jgi:hypothetical protein
MVLILSFECLCHLALDRINQPMERYRIVIEGNGTQDQSEAAFISKLNVKKALSRASA